MFLFLEQQFSLFNVIFTIGILFLILYLYFQYCYTYWARKGVPHLKPKFPLGNNPIVGPEAVTYGLEVEDWYNQFKKMGARIGGVWNFHNKALVITDPELVKDVLTKDFEVFGNRDFFSGKEADPKANHLFVMEYEEWKGTRQYMTPAFTTSRMKFMFESVLKCSDLLVDLFAKASKSKNCDVPLRLILDKYTMDNIGIVAFGLEFNCLLSEDTKLRRIADLFARPKKIDQLKRIAIRVMPELCKKLRFRVLDKETTDFFENLVLNNFEQREKLGIKRNDFTQILMDMKNKGGMTENINDLIANCVIFFFAGFDTSSKTMQYALMELARNQDIQDKARKEVFQVLNKYNGILTYDALQELIYIRQIMDETLRLYPPVLTLSRISRRDYKFKGSDVTIEKGTTVLISVTAFHKDPDYFPNPLKYDPDRFSPENKSSIVPYSYLPFGDGPRNCIGRRFGLMQGSIGLIRILSNYKIELGSDMKYPMNFEYGQFLIKTDEIYLKITKL